MHFDFHILNNFLYYKFHLIISDLNIDRTEIINRCQEIPNVNVYENVSDMGRLMQSVDVSISASGSTLYELCATQTPTITYVIADNQIVGAEGFRRQGIMDCIGDIRKMEKDTGLSMLIESAVGLCSDYSKRQNIVTKMAATIDGFGSQRIVEKLLK